MHKNIVKYVLLIALLIGGCAADMASKKWAKDNLKDKHGITIIHGLTELGFAENRGMVFGILNNGKTGVHSYFLLGVRILILIGVCGFLVVKRREPVWFHVPFILIVAGAWGNILDSLTAGHVVDFIHIHALNLLDWPFLFNIADAYICVGIGFLIIKSLFVKKSVVDKKDIPVSPV